MTEGTDVLEGATFDEKLKIYYDHLYPYNQMIDWLSYESEDDGATLSRREFTFTLKDDVYIRYRSFQNKDEFAKEVKKIRPYKIDLGPVYNAEPKKRKGLAEGTFQPLQREIVFDIDLSDYDDVRTCCAAATICKKCWGFMAVAIRVLNRICREEFGFENIFFVYSGRRGVHCWIADERARMYPNEIRSAIADYLFVVTQSDKNSRRTNLRDPLHPTFKIIHDEVLLPALKKDLLPSQDFLRTEAQMNYALQMLPDENVQQKLRTKWKPTLDVAGQSLKRWEDMETACKGRKDMELALIAMAFAYTFPRLDANVTKQMNHLLKAPFCVHPKSERLCVILDPSKVSSFNPDTVPTLTDVLQQFKGAEVGEPSSPPLEEAVLNFEKLFLRPLKASLSRKKIKHEQLSPMEW